MLPMCKTSKDAVIPPEARHQSQYSVENQKKGGLVGRHGVPLSREGKSSETDEPKVQIAASARPNLPATSGESILMSKPLYTPRRHRPETPSSSTHKESSYRNNKSEGYHLPVAPPGSYQDDDTGPSPRTLVTAVIGMKRAVTHFAKVLDTDMKKHPVEMEKLKQAIRDEVKAEVERPNDWKFLVRAFICQRLFHDFDAPNGYFGLEDFAQDKMTTIISFADFAKFKDLTATISKLMKPPSPDKPDLEKSLFLERFCFKKFQFIFGEDASALYRDELAAVKSAYHPKSVFYQSFLNVAVSVWLLHRLVHSFDEKVEMLTYKPGSPFQRQNMESVVPGVIDDDDDEENDVNTKVVFTVIPGFQVSRSVIKCAVYIPDEKVDRSETTHRPSIDKSPVTPISSDKTPIKLDPSTDKSPAKSSSSNKPSTKLETLFANDDNQGGRRRPGSLQTSEGVTSFSNYDTQVPPRSGNVAVATVANAGEYWQKQPRLSPGNSARANPKSKRESAASVFSIPAPAGSRPHNPNGAPFAARDTKLSASRRQAANAQKSVTG